jgi:threonine/homoserine/homoserine lactone efflux protein
LTALLPVIGLLVAAAITPGPNNFIVLEAGARRGLLAASRVIAGVVIGSLVLLALVWAGIAAMIEAAPSLQMMLSVSGGLYLGWLGAAMASNDPHKNAEEGAFSLARARLPSSLVGVATFQLLNPKAWVLVTTAAAAMAGSDSVVVLGALIAVISALCLLLWAIAGRALSGLLEKPRPRLWFDRSMGALLLVSALGLIVDALL